MSSPLSYANTNISETAMVITAKKTCVWVNLSCDILAFVCGSTTAAIVEGAIELDDWACGD